MTDDLPARLEAALTERFTELGNPFSAMRRHEQGPDGWPASHPVGPHQVAEVLRELIGRTAVDGPRLPNHTVNEEETPDACHPDESIAGLRRPAPRDRHRSAWKALTPQQQAAYLAQLDNDKAQQKPCAECDHPKAVHSEGEDPVSPGRCTTCPDSGEEWHDYQAAEASAPADRCPHGCNVSVCPCLECEAEQSAANWAAILQQEADRIRAHCPDHLDSDSQPGSWMVCHCDVADDMLRRLADAASGPGRADGETQQDEPESLPLLFWDEPAGVVYEDGRITAWLSRAVSLAHSVPAGQLILQPETAARLRRALTTALGAADDAARKACRCSHPANEHTVYGCEDDCGCEWMPSQQPAAVSQPGKEA